MLNNEAESAAVQVNPPTKNLRMFCLGLVVRLAGLALILIGDGSDSLFRKALVVVGVILTVGGIAVLRYLLLAKPLSRLRSTAAKK